MHKSCQMELVLACMDPGAGSLVVRAVAAGLVAIPIVFRNQLRRSMVAPRGHDRPSGES